MKKKINVLMVGSALSVKGGMTSVVKSFINNKNKEYDIHYIPTHIEKNIIFQMIFFIVSLFKIFFCLIFNNISIIHIHVSERGSFSRKMIVAKIGKLLKKKIVLHMHGAEFKEFFNSCSSSKQKKIVNFLEDADKVIVLGNSWNKYVKGLSKNIDTIIMPNSVRCVNETVKLEENKINILYLAVIIQRKGIFDLINSAKALLDDKELEDYEINFIIAGTGAEEDKAKEMVKNLKLENNFEFKGWVEEEQKRELLKESQLFVLPSYNEGLPVAILEAMSYGIPIISTNVGSIEDAVKNNFNGSIISPGDIDALKESLKLFILDKEVWNKCSKNSKMLIKEIYDEKKYFEKISELYAKLVCNN